MDRVIEPRSARQTRRWTGRVGRHLAPAMPVLVLLLLVSSSPVAACMQPTPGGIDDPRGSGRWSGWSALPTSGWATAPAWPGAPCGPASVAGRWPQVSGWRDGYLLAAGLMAHLDELDHRDCRPTASRPAVDAGCPFEDRCDRGWR